MNKKRDAEHPEASELAETVAIVRTSCSIRYEAAEVSISPCHCELPFNLSGVECSWLVQAQINHSYFLVKYYPNPSG
jgi:hypothetical protein